jgi:hypothetical protein
MYTVSSNRTPVTGVLLLLQLVSYELNPKHARFVALIDIPVSAVLSHLPSFVTYCSMNAAMASSSLYHEEKI